jgi:class 3 adenylate cyclase
MGDCPRCGQTAAPGANFCAGCGMRLAGREAPGPHARKTVTVLFADVTGFTALSERLDPESLEQVMARYFTAMRDVVARHGGTVEKFIGDGFMVVFGVPVVHEDDAARAARAALEMRAALEPLNEELARRWDVHLRTHTGINTGEVVVGESFDGQPLTLGDTVNVAQRLESEAGPGEILLGPATGGGGCVGA